MILRANKRDHTLIIVIPLLHMLQPSLKRNAPDEKNVSFSMCRVALNLLHIIAWGGQETQKVSCTEGFSHVHLLIVEDFLKPLPLVVKGKVSSFPNIFMYEQYSQNMKRLYSIVFKSLDSGIRLPGLKNYTISYRVYDLGQVMCLMCASLSSFMKYDDIVPISCDFED